VATKRRIPDLVIPEFEGESIWCAVGCSRQTPCNHCREAVRAEALNWLADLADDLPSERPASVSVVESQGWLRK
jgi:hypothetical protein